ncbi:MAG TPA: hypothetical protein VFR48_07565 [Solirubrobacteraceae bacterium]|nr:hypothetical protein [Solirubrobacteraceae bacterium]
MGKVPSPQSTSLDASVPSDIVLLLRADAEQSWLNREVIPVLRQIETLDPVSSEQVGAALAYLESSWNEATLRARQTDAAGDLGAERQRQTQLGERAERYHTAVRALRGIVAERVSAYVEPATSTEPVCARIA